MLSLLPRYYFQCRFTKREALREKQLPCVESSGAVLLQFMLMKQTSHFVVQVDMSSVKHQFRPGFLSVNTRSAKAINLTAADF